MVEKFLAIFCTHFNFIAKGKDGQSPTMGLGRDKGPILFEDVIYFE